MIIGAGSQFPRNNSHCVFQLQNGSGTTFTDTSNGKTGNKTGTAAGSAAWSASSPPSGWKSFMIFDGTGDYVAFADHDDFAIGLNPFTIESLVYINEGNTGSCYIFSKDYLTSTAKFYGLEILIATPRFKYVGTNATFGAIPLGEWVHLAVCRESTGTNKTYLFVNGIRKNTITCSADLGSNVGAYEVGVFNDKGQRSGFWNGNIAYLRMFKNACLWTRNFTPPNRAS